MTVAILHQPFLQSKTQKVVKQKELIEDTRVRIGVGFGSQFAANVFAQKGNIGEAVAESIRRLDPISLMQTNLNIVAG